MGEPNDLTILTLQTTPALVEGLADWVREAWNMEPVELDRPRSEEVWLELYFEDETEALLAREIMRGREGVAGVAMRTCANTDWQSFWRRHFTVLDIGRRIRIRPEWTPPAELEPDRVEIVLNPGLSFGTGGHFTTRFCLEMIDNLCQKSAPASLLDLGTGSGILAIAAVRLGCRNVVAVDHDAEAIKGAEENLALNGVRNLVDLRTMDITVAPGSEKFEVVCANLYGQLLVEVAANIRPMVRRRLVLSGIREPEVEMVADTYARLGGRELVRDGDGEWAGLVMEFGE